MGVTMDKQRTFRKVGRMGNSPGISLPPEYLDKINIKRGDECEVIIDEQRNEIRIRPVQPIPEGLSPQFMKALDETHQQYQKAIRNLRDR
ncbi:antitoxin MazE [Melghirimyces thermohalophilus]|uniref:Antitoxin MazE n=1 Tax=Melghirimyces thermohalophilus TaxID=1236220 RepID=A0A1G6ID81_9BACL|nr:AbrB/MazE/SpoVT family DNA-binding domain-containing protein [Melghirimyces thermohalophilus]SDC04507.1 antitoxin MazE [Melghirimyces thermohalophilus]